MKTMQHALSPDSPGVLAGPGVVREEDEKAKPGCFGPVRLKTLPTGH
ncbi:hypothetical protein [Paractinoplanes deccanensis]|nr:hypothetical protein [Actinoplanes deccanensis]